MPLPLPDFASHPAYCDLEAEPLMDDTILRDRMRTLDEIQAQLVGPSGPATMQELIDGFESTYMPELQALEATCAENCAADPRIVAAIKEACTYTRAAILREMLYTFEAKSHVSTLTPASQAVADRMKDIGWYAMTVSDSVVADIYDVLEPVRDKLTGPEVPMREGQPVALKGRFGKLVSDVIREAHILEGLSANTGHDMEICYAALTRSSAKQTWWRDCYADVGLPTSRTVYQHYDEADNFLKGTLYIAEVTEADGPFKISSRADVFDAANVQQLMWKGLDRSMLKHAPHLGDAKGYYRPVFHSPAGRAHFRRLPACFQMASHFGDDILDGTPLSEALLASETSFTTKLGNLIFFDGSRVIHRGSNCTTGTRWAIQFGIQAKPPVLNRLLRDTRGEVAYRVKGLLGERGASQLRRWFGRG